MVSPMVGRVLWEDVVAGAVGAAVMTAGEKREQRLTGRPSSRVPARTLARVTGVGEWPRQELVVDVLHKAVYAFTTGIVADALAARHGPGPGQRHAARRPGRQADVGPVPRSEGFTVG